MSSKVLVLVLVLGCSCSCSFQMWPGKARMPSQARKPGLVKTQLERRQVQRGQVPELVLVRRRRELVLELRRQRQLQGLLLVLEQTLEQLLLWRWLERQRVLPQGSLKEMKPDMAWLIWPEQSMQHCRLKQIDHCK